MRTMFDRFRATEAHPGQGPGCLDEVTLAAAADGVASPEALAHLSRCAACRGALAHLARLLGDEDVASEVRQLDVHPLRRWRAPLLVAAAAAIALMVAIPALRNDGDAAQFRDEPPVEAWPAPSLTTPAAAVAGSAIPLRWSAVEQASQYRVTVFDEEGSVVWSAEVPEAAVTIPADAGLEARTYWWRVEARVDFDRWSASPLGELHVSAP